jgi:prolyl oligopeptidase
VGERGGDTDVRVIDLVTPMHPRLDASAARVLGDRPANHTPFSLIGDTLYVLTDLDALHRRVIAVDLARAEAQPRVIVPESEHTIERAVAVGGRIALHLIADAQSRLRLVDRVGSGATDISLPGIGAVGWIDGSARSPELYYEFSSFLAPTTVYAYDVNTRKSMAFHPPRTTFDAARYDVRQVFYASRDGTRVPMFIVSRHGLPRDGTAPAVLTAYGGYGATNLPTFRPDVALWLELGGVYALASIRGGGEYGEAWHRAGMREHKQNSVDDFIAAAERLAADGWAARDRIGIEGYSNGGMLVGAAITQRPDLFAVAVAKAGHYDMLRYHRFTIASAWIPEFGSADSASDYPSLRAYSPLQRVSSGPCYPATLLLAADHDDRVVPSHSYKFAAALQAAQRTAPGCARPVLLRVAADASHGYAARGEQLAESADKMTYFVHSLGVRLR